jgi:hypothetical protein
MSIHVTPPTARPLPEGILPASQLRITENELKALLWTRELIATGQMRHDPAETREFAYGFNMNFSLSGDGELCGTTGCIGGWMYLFMQRNRMEPAFLNGQQNGWCSAMSYVHKHKSAALHELFYPLATSDAYGNPLLGNCGADIDYPAIPPEWALEAIDNFLTAGAPEWDVVTGQA